MVWLGFESQHALNEAMTALGVGDAQNKQQERQFPLMMQVSNEGCHGVLLRCIVRIIPPMQCAGTGSPFAELVELRIKRTLTECRHCKGRHPRSMCPDRRDPKTGRAPKLGSDCPTCVEGVRVNLLGYPGDPLRVWLRGLQLGPDYYWDRPDDANQVGGAGGDHSCLHMLPIIP